MGFVVELKGLVRGLSGIAAQGLVVGSRVLVAGALLVLDPGVGAVALAEVVVRALALVVGLRKKVEGRG